MAALQSIFLVGAGYIGQNVLDQLLAAKYPVTVFVRRPEQATLFEKAGAKTVLGTLSDLELLTIQAAQHDITINTASCDDLPSVEAILSGVRQRVHAGLPSTYLHTGGTGVLEDGALGMYKNSKIYRDDVPADIDAVAPTAMHRHVDIAITQAAREIGDKAKIVILLPPLVYGLTPAHKRHTLILGGLVPFTLKHGFSGYVGEGHNVWSVVHVRDLARAFMTLLEHVKRSAPAVFLENPYFFAENGSEVSMRETAEHLGRILFDSGKIQSPEPQSFSESDYDGVFGPFTPRALGCNSRSRAIRLRDLLWEPKEKDIWTSWREEEISSIVAALDAH
jgi:nucleoside-diphosphate-sugar epimerase